MRERHNRRTDSPGENKAAGLGKGVIIPREHWLMARPLQFQPCTMNLAVSAGGFKPLCKDTGVESPASLFSQGVQWPLFRGAIFFVLATVLDDVSRLENARVRVYTFRIYSSRSRTEIESSWFLFLR